MINFGNKKYILIFILSIFVSVTVLIGGSYALIQRVLVGNNTYTMRTGNFLVEFSDTQEIVLTNQTPVYDNVGINGEQEFVFDVSNTGNYVSSYSLKIEQTGEDDLSSVIRYAIDFGDGYKYDNIHLLANNPYIIQNKSLAINGIDSYRLKFWLDIDANENYAGKAFNAKVVIETTQEEYKYGTNVLKSVYNSNEEGLVAVGSNGLVYASGDLREYRYSGNNVNNYVWFNCDNGYNSGIDHCEKWRIIGSYENGIGNYQMLKIVRDESLETMYQFNSNTGNIANFDDSSIQKYLNETYYEGLNDDTKKMIMNAKWNIGAVLNSNSAVSNYSTEKNITSYNYIGLINASDYGYATNTTLWDTSLNTTSITADNNWLYQENTLIINTPNMLETNVYYISANGLSEGMTTTNYNIKPTLYLKPDVSIINGYGTSEEPYELSIKYPMDYGTKTEIKAQEVTYDLNGGVGNIESTYVGAKITSDVPTREGYTFKGWSTNKDATEAEYQSGASYTGEPVTLYAVWYRDNVVPTCVAMYGNISNGTVFDVELECIDDSGLLDSEITIDDVTFRGEHPNEIFIYDVNEYNKIRYMILFDINPIGTYTFNLRSGAVSDIYGNVNDSYSISFEVVTSSGGGISGGSG